MASRLVDASSEKRVMKVKQVEELILQSLEHELGGIKIYTAALECAVNEGLKEEWRTFLEETQSHVEAPETICSAMKIAADALQLACDQIEDQEDEYLYHTKGWCRELWLQSLGLKAALPPPEERRHVKTAIGAVRAEQPSERTR